MTKKIIIGVLFLLPLVAQAATSKVVYDAGSGILSVSGACSQRFVLVVVRKSSDGSIWGSSNPACVNGVYQYEADVPDADQTGSTFTVQAFDQASAGGGVPTAANGTMTGAGEQAIVFAPPPPAPSTTLSVDSMSLTIDTSSLAAAPDDVSFLDGVLQTCFGIITSAMNAVESSVVAAVHVFAKMFTILPGGSIAVPQGQNQIAGQGSLPAGSSEVFIANTSVTSSSQIIVTPTSPTQVPLAVTQLEDGNGFTVGAIIPQQIPVSFTWLVIGTYVAGPPNQPGTAIVSQVSAPQVSAPVAPVLPPADISSTDVTATDTIDIQTSTPPVDASATDITDATDTITN